MARSVSRNGEEARRPTLALSNFARGNPPLREERPAAYDLANEGERVDSSEATDGELAQVRSIHHARIVRR